MRVWSFAILLAACAAVPAATEARGRVIDTSWGKPGVSLEQYREDAVLCARVAMARDVSDTDAARTLIDASRALESAESRWGAANSGTAGMTGGGQVVSTGDAINLAVEHRRLRETYRPERQFAEIAELQQRTLDLCLAELGYRRFRLTDAQKRELRRLELGSEARRTYLHRLASDPEVLDRQGQ